MPRYAIVFNDEWVREHSPDELRAKSAAVGVVVDDLRARGALVWTDGALGRSSCIGTAEPTPAGVVVRPGPYRERAEWLGGLCVVDAADDDTAMAWARRLAEALDWPQEVHRFPHVVDGVRED